MRPRSEKVIVVQRRVFFISFRYDFEKQFNGAQLYSTHTHLGVSFQSPRTFAVP